MTDVLVFLPGVLGSELWLGNDKIWPGSLVEAITGFSEERFKTLLTPDLVAKDIVRTAAGVVGVYSQWIKALEAISRKGVRIFREVPETGETKTLFAFAYDWRKDLIQATELFADYLDNVVIVTVPNGDIHLVCHSLGGLIARYYLESKNFEHRAAYGRIKLLATFGTPHNGAPIAFAGAAGLHKTNFLSLDQSKRLANDSRYPALFQIFPDNSHRFIWSAKMSDRYSTFDTDDSSISAAYTLEAKNMSKWAAFRAGLSGNRPNSVRYFYVIGSRQETLVRFLWDGNSLTKVELDEAGDGTVPLAGAMQSGTQSDFVARSHVDLIDSRPSRETLARLFGADTLFAVDGTTISLSIRDRVVTTEDDIHVQIIFDPGVSVFKGALTWQRAKLPADGSEPGQGDFRDFPSGGVQRIEVIGTHTSYLNVLASPMLFRGIYRPVLTGDAAPPSPPILGPAFFVQSPGAG
jgi:hypothetical protein